jgi:hypothetical protein
MFFNVTPFGFMSLKEANPNHDEKGQFSSSPGTAAHQTELEKAVAKAGTTKDQAWMRYKKSPTLSHGDAWHSAQVAHARIDDVARAHGQMVGGRTPAERADGEGAYNRAKALLTQGY